MQHGEGTARIEAFSDGVMAIAITLLVLEIKIPSHAVVEEHGLTHALGALWPGYLAFVTSFVSILLIWVKHHWMISLIERTDHPFLYWNGLLLLCITFLTFPTGLLAEYLLHAEGKVATSLYAATVLAISLAFKGLWWHATRNSRLMANHPTLALSTEVRRITEQDRYGPLFYLVAFIASFFSEILGILICLLVSLVFAFRDWSAKG